MKKSIIKIFTSLAITVSLVELVSPSVFAKKKSFKPYIPSVVKVDKPKKHKRKYFGKHYNKKGDLIRYFYTKSGEKYVQIDSADGTGRFTEPYSNYKQELKEAARIRKNKKIISGKPYTVITQKRVDVFRTGGSIDTDSIISSKYTKRGHIKKGSKLQITQLKFSKSWVVYQNTNTGTLWCIDEPSNDQRWFKFVK